ncbi:MAG: glycerol acyltransferase [Synechococcaceae cyanobacterium RL_1_2]|nr:glycerol acyltransferase [Synechococcaceae cyanobacterium RL_1_2]
MRDHSGWSLEGRDPEEIRKLMPWWRWFYEHYFHVTSSGWEHLDPDRATLIVGSHNGGLAAPDMIMFMYDWFKHFGVEKPAYGLVHPYMWKFYRWLADSSVKTGGIVAHPTMGIKSLEAGYPTLVYPGGAQDVFRPYWDRHKINFAGRRGFIKLALRQGVPIVPVISTGAHETIIVLAEFADWIRQLQQLTKPPAPFNFDPQVFPIYLGLPWGIGIGPLLNWPAPNKITLRICPPITFNRVGRDASRDRAYVDECYYIVKHAMQKSLIN